MILDRLEVVLLKSICTWDISKFGNVDDTEKRESFVSKEVFYRRLVNGEKQLRDWLVFSQKNQILYCFPCFFFGNMYEFKIIFYGGFQRGEGGGQWRMVPGVPVPIETALVLEIISYSNGRIILNAYISEWLEPIQMGPQPIDLKWNFTSENVEFEADWLISIRF